MRASDLVGRMVVTIEGDDLAQIKDVVYEPTAGSVTGFTVTGAGFLAEPKRQTLRWRDVHALGRHAVMVTGTDRLTDAARFEAGPARSADLLSETTVTDAGTALGTVTDVLLAVGAEADVIGFEIVTTSALPPAGRRALIPRSATCGESGEAILVPDIVRGYVTSDLAGFEATLPSWRAFEHRAH
jgi:sporulation protein YlmC with PRC-barrel domain